MYTFYFMLPKDIPLENKRFFSRFVHVGLITTVLLIVSLVSFAQQKPNVIIILADDLGYGDVSCLNSAAKTSTPAIDKMASEGAIFLDAHSPASLCTPTRYSILTGRFGWRSTLKKGVLKQYDPPLIEAGRTTIGGLFKKANYATACIGKWHLGWDWTLFNGNKVSDSISDNSTPAERLRIESFINYQLPLQNGPTTRGFDYYFGDDVPNYPPYCFFENDHLIGNLNTTKPDTMYGHPGKMIKGWNLEEVMPAITNKAVAYIHENAANKKPFFLYFTLTAPHVPIAPNKNFRGKSKAGLYGDFVAEVDWSVSEILKAVSAAGIDSNTLIIFSSDNGSTGQDGTNMSGAMNSIFAYNHYPNYIFRGMKTDTWEGGHHIPFIARWPNTIKKSTVIGTTICQVDLMATCAEILNMRLKANEGEDSYSLLPLLLSNKQSYTRPYTIHHSSEGYFAIRKDDWKLIMASGSGGGLVPDKLESINGSIPPLQLYNLVLDIGEKKNLFAEYPEKVIELKNILIQCIQDGRSTRGPKQKNNGQFIYETTKWLQQ